MNNTDHLLNIKNIIEKNQSITHLRKYFSDNTINPSDYNDFKNLIIYAIEKKASNEIITFLLDQRQDKNANFEMVENGKKKTPLLLAVINDNYTLADILIDKYKADINYIYKEGNYRIAEFLYNNNNNYYLTSKRLKYVLKKGCILTYRFLYGLIRNKDNILYKLQYTCRKFKNDDIIEFLELYNRYKEKKESLSKDDIHKLNDELKSLIKENKGRLLVNDELYKKSKDYNNEALMITFENENAEENVILNRIINYNLFEKAIDLGNYNYIKKILGYKPLHYMCKDYNKILLNLIKKYLTPNEIDKKENVAKLVINYFIKTSVLINNKNNTSNLISDKGIPFRNLILNIAIENKNLDAVKCLIESFDYKYTSDEINTKDIKGKYPIFTAVEVGSYDIFKYLINKIDNLNIKNNNGISLQNFIINENQEYMCEYLLKYFDSIAINENDSSGFTPLENGINKNNANIVQMILNYGLKHEIDLNFNEKDNTGNLPLINAINKNNFDMIFAIIDSYKQKKIDVNIYDNNGNTPITLLYKNYINSGKSDSSMFNKIFDYLLEYYDINKTDLAGNTVLYYAICNKDIDVMKKLLNMGANLLLKNNFKKSPMDIAFNQKSYDVFKIIIEYGNIDFNIENTNGDSFLMTIIKSNKFSNSEKLILIEYLIKKGVNINFLDKNGNIPLEYASHSDLSIYNLLRKNGAYSTFNNENNSFLDELVQSEKYDLLDIICNSDSGYEIKELKFNSYSLLMRNNKCDLLKKIIINSTQNFNIDMKNEENGNTLLHEAIYNNNIDIIQFLIDYGANKYIKNNDGENAINYNLNKNHGNKNHISKILED